MWGVVRRAMAILSPNPFDLHIEIFVGKKGRRLFKGSFQAKDTGNGTPRSKPERAPAGDRERPRQVKAARELAPGPGRHTTAT